jgi:hypothetical protein
LIARLRAQKIDLEVDAERLKSPIDESLVARLRAQKIDLEVEAAAQKLDSRIEAERLKSPIDEISIARLRAQKLDLRIDAERLKSPIDQARVHQLETEIQAMHDHIAQLTAQLPQRVGSDDSLRLRIGTNAIILIFFARASNSLVLSSGLPPIAENEVLTGRLDAHVSRQRRSEAKSGSLTFAEFYEKNTPSQKDEFWLELKQTCTVEFPELPEWPDKTSEKRVQAACDSIFNDIRLVGNAPITSSYFNTSANKYLDNRQPDATFVVPDWQPSSVAVLFVAEITVSNFTPGTDFRIWFDLSCILFIFCLQAKKAS